MSDLPNAPFKPGENPTFRLIRVVNRNDFPINDMYDGVPYVFRPNEPLSIPPEAAQHFFAWPHDDEKYVRSYIARRLGWNTQADIARQPDGRMRWEHWAANISIIPQEFDLVPRDPAAPIPAIADGDVMTEEEAPLKMPAEPHDELSATRGGTRKRNAPRRVNV